jgi:hypothetical protein
MAKEPTLEERLAEVEAAVRELRRRLDSQAPAPDWLDRVIGSFKDEPAFEEVLEYGRALRQADRPPEDAEQ